MQIRLADFIKDAPDRSELESILRSCVHCGFCNATCPTYQLLGDELDGPRGRIYLLKQVLEGQTVTRLTQMHLDRCLTCRACETTCPSGVKYGQLLDAGRAIVDKKVGRKIGDRLARILILNVFPYRRRFDALMKLARWLRPIAPPSVKKKIPLKAATPAWPETKNSRKMLILPGCVQQSLAPSIDYAAALVLNKLGISLLPVHAGVCCGALPYHLSEHDTALALVRKNIDACRPFLEQGAEAVVTTASGCGVMLKDYGRLLQHDADYAESAARFSASVKDISEVLAQEDLSIFKGDRKKIAFQSPCSLQHGQKLSGLVETILEKAGFQLAEVADAHLCCGSAGVYSLLEPHLSLQLLSNKMQALEACQADMIATANIGCLSQLRSSGCKNAVHWIELLI